MNCHDCPDLDAAYMEPGWTPRPKCCRDEHIERRLNGDPEPWEGIGKARAISDAPEPPKSRQQRRWEARKGK